MGALGAGLTVPSGNGTSGVVQFTVGTSGKARPLEWLVGLIVILGWLMWLPKGQLSLVWKAMSTLLQSLKATGGSLRRVRRSILDPVRKGEIASKVIYLRRLLLDHGHPLSHVHFLHGNVEMAPICHLPYYHRSDGIAEEALPPSSFSQSTPLSPFTPDVCETYHSIPGRRTSLKLEIRILRHFAPT